MTRERTVLAVIEEVDPTVFSGSASAFVRVAPELEARGWRLHYWTAVPSATQRALESQGAEVRGEIRGLKFSLPELRTSPGVRKRLAGVPGYARRFDAALREINPDVVLGNTVFTLPELAIARMRRSPTLLYVHEILPRRPRYAAARRLLSLVSDEILCDSNAAAAQFEGSRRRPRVVHYGIEVPETVIRAAAERRTNEGDGPMVVGAIGTISPRKGTDMLVAAARRVLAERSDLEFRLCGLPIEGADRAWAEAVLADGAALGIRHLGQVDPFEELPNWDMLLLPSRQEPFGLVVLEAMAVGVPVIASDVGGVPELLGDGTGVLVPPDDPDALAEAILTLADDRDRRHAFAEAGRERAAREFRLDKQADGVETALEAAISRHEKRQARSAG